MITKIKIQFFYLAIFTSTISVSIFIPPTAPNVPAPVVAPAVVKPPVVTAASAPVAKVVAPVVPVASIPKAIVAAPKVSAPAVPAPKVVAPKIAAPVVSAPVAPKAAVPVVPAPPVPVAKVVAPSAPALAPQATFVADPKGASLDIGIVSVKNMTNYPASWTGFKVKLKTAEGTPISNSKSSYKFNPSHPLKTVSDHKHAQSVQSITVKNLPVGAYLEGISFIGINGEDVNVEYKGQAWLPGITNAIYITSTDHGQKWVLDTKEMDKNYKRISSGISKAPVSQATEMDDDSISKVTDATKAATVPVVLKNSKNKERIAKIVDDVNSVKKSKSSKAFKRTATSATKIM